MVNKLVLPQELETFYVIPSLRKHLALVMAEQGMKQKDVAALLGVNTAAISQYRSRKRGGRVEFNNVIMDEIRKAAGQIRDRLGYIRETQRLLRLVRTSGALCQIHKQMAPIPSHCEPALVDCHTAGRCG